MKITLLNKISVVCILIAMLLSSSISSAAENKNKSAVTAVMKKLQLRYPKLLKAKQDGKSIKLPFLIIFRAFQFLEGLQVLQILWAFSRQTDADRVLFLHE